MGFTRRDILKFTGGSAAGLALTPVPWSLLRDSSLVSETWPGVPQPAQGEIHARYTTCTLCPAGCGVRARCVGDQPVSLAGVAQHPASRGALCSTGLVGHHLAFCRDRMGGADIERALADVSAAIAACRPHEAVALVDPRPGRTASGIYRRFLAGLPNGVYCAPPDAQPFGSYGIDLENTRAVLSFGASVLDGWLSPGRVLANRSHFQLIQVEPAYSRTASLADLWVPVAPGGEESFAAAVERALQGDTSDSEATRAARILLQNQPAVAVGNGPAVTRINAALGNIGRPGGFLPRRDFAPATEFSSLPDASIRVLFIEESAGGEPLHPELVQRKLVARDPVVVALTPWRDGAARHATYVIPAPMYLESLDEAPTSAGATRATFSLSPALLAAPAKLITPADFILRLGHDSTTYADILKQRVAAIKKENHGTLFNYSDATSQPVAALSTADDLWKALLAGAIWQDDPGMPSRRPDLPPSVAAPAPQPTPTSAYPLLLISAAPPRATDRR